MCCHGFILASSIWNIQSINKLLLNSSGKQTAFIVPVPALCHKLDKQAGQWNYRDLHWNANVVDKNENIPTENTPSIAAVKAVHYYCPNDINFIADFKCNLSNSVCSAKRICSRITVNSNQSSVAYFAHKWSNEPWDETVGTVFTWWVEETQEVGHAWEAVSVFLNQLQPLERYITSYYRSPSQLTDKHLHLTVIICHPDSAM